MQITRQRVKPATKINTDVTCQACDGTGKSTPSILVMDQIERDFEFILNNQPSTNLKLEAHPFIIRYLTKGLPSLRMKWWRKYGKWLKTTENENLNLKQFKFYNTANDEIRLN